METATLHISDQQKQQYREEGYFVLEEVIPDQHLQILRDECQYFIDLKNAEMDQEGKDVAGITHRNSRYFISNRHQERPRMREFIFSDLTAAICRATLGTDAFLFWEQYVVKGAEIGLPFSWHQDSGYLGYDHRPYMSCWCALDDMSEENGTAYILPFSRAGTRARQQHTVDAATNDKVGYFGDDPGIPVLAAAGSIAVFSSVNFHRSGTNTSDKMRRVYLSQYAAAPIMNREGTQVQGFAEPFLKDGIRVDGEF
jgi:ectoine hydroxylase-related dioxygenase (phytanoyl-CoA dioxygenase family)